MKWRQPVDEILHRENPRREHRIAAVGLVHALQQPPPSTTVRQNHRHIVLGDFSVIQKLVDNMVQEGLHVTGCWLLAISFWLLAMKYDYNYNNEL